jgi:hypothetical protein
MTKITLKNSVDIYDYLEFETRVTTNRLPHQGRILYIQLLRLCPFRARPERTSFLCPSDLFEAHTPVLFAEEFEALHTLGVCSKRGRAFQRIVVPKQGSERGIRHGCSSREEMRI